MADVTALDEQTLDVELARSGGAAPLLLDLWGPQCAPCERMAPVLKELARQYGANLRVAKLDVSKAPEVAKRFAVRAIPTLLLVREGQEQDRQVGFVNVQELRHWLGRHAIAPSAEAPPQAMDHGHGAFYGDAQLRDFLIRRLGTLASECTDLDRENQQWPGGWRSLSQALVQHEDPEVFQRVTGLPASMQGLLDLVGGHDLLTEQQITELLCSIPAGAPVDQLALRLLHNWLADEAEGWPALLADPGLDALRLEWLATVAQLLEGTEPGLAQWSKLRDRLLALDTRETEPARALQDRFATLLASLSPPPPGFSSFWDQRLRRLAGSVLMNQARFAIGWSHADIGMEIVLFRWFSAREAQEAGGRFTAERLAEAQQQWCSEQSVYMAKYDAFMTGGSALMQRRYSGIRKRLIRLLAA